MNSLRFLLIAIAINHCFLIYGQQDRIAIAKNNRQIQRILQSVDPYTEDFKVRSISKMKMRSEHDKFIVHTADSLSVDQAFYKSDFDQNGFVDAIVYSNKYDISDAETCVLMNFGGDSILYQRLSVGRFTQSIAKVVCDTLIEVHRRVPNPCGVWNWEQHFKKDTLIFKFNRFVEKKATIEQPEVSSVSLKVSAEGYTGVGVSEYSILINEDGKGKLIKKSNDSFLWKENDKEEEITHLNEEQVREIVDLLNFIDVCSLKDCYDDHASHTMKYEWEFSFRNADKKNITDLGFTSSFGMEALLLVLYSYFY